MKCPQCNAPTLVLTTVIKPGKVLRRRECFNLHRFSTVETVRTDLPAQKNRRQST